MNPALKRALLAYQAFSILEETEDEIPPPRKRRMWVREWLQKKELQGCFENLVRELLISDPDGFRTWARMDKSSFEEILSLVAPQIIKKNTSFREAIRPEKRLAIALRYLATGESQTSLAFSFRESQSVISGIIPEVCIAIYETLRGTYLKIPNSEDDWRAVAMKFEDAWDFPNCIGAIDGKHVLLEAPPNSSSLFYNYKGTFSIVLLALVDAEYRFLYVDVGKNGRISDSGVWNQCSLKTALESKSLNIPTGRVLPGANSTTPYVIVADEGFGLKPYMMKPFPQKHLNDEQRTFNYRLSRARRVVENAFGHLVRRFECFRSAIRADVDKVKSYVLAAVVLHNFLQSRKQEEWFFAGETEANSSGLTSVRGCFGNRSSGSAQKIRETFMSYFQIH